MADASELRPPLRLLSDDDLEFVQRFVLASGSLSPRLCR